MQIVDMRGMTDRLKEARSRRYRSARQAALAMGVPYGTYSGHEAGTRSPDLETLERYASFFRVSAEWLAFGNSNVNQTPNMTPSKQKAASIEVDVVPIVGIVEAGAFRVVDDLTQIAPEDAPGVTVPRDARYDGMRCFAFEVRGDSMDRVIPDGAYIVAVDVIDYTERYGQISTGRLVVVERSDGGHTRERTVKEMVVFSDRVELRPQSSNPAHKPIIVKIEDLDDGREVRIVGVVSGAHRQL